MTARRPAAAFEGPAAATTLPGWRQHRQPKRVPLAAKEPPALQSPLLSCNRAVRPAAPTSHSRSCHLLPLPRSMVATLLIRAHRPRTGSPGCPGGGGRFTSWGSDVGEKSAKGFCSELGLERLALGTQENPSSSALWGLSAGRSGKQPTCVGAGRWCRPRPPPGPHRVVDASGRVLALRVHSSLVGGGVSAAK